MLQRPLLQLLLPAGLTHMSRSASAHSKATLHQHSRLPSQHTLPQQLLPQLRSHPPLRLLPQSPPLQLRQAEATLAAPLVPRAVSPMSK